MTDEKYEGFCIGKVNNRVVVKSKSVNKVMNFLIKNHPNKTITLSSIPKRNKVFIL